LTYLASYTWANRSITAARFRGTSADILPQNSRCRKCDYGYAAFNVQTDLSPPRLRLPFRQRKRFASGGGFLNQIIGGWQLGSIVTWQSGLAINTQASVDTPGTGGYGEIRLNLTGISPNLPADQTIDYQVFNVGACYSAGARNFRQHGADALRGPSLFTWDASTLNNFQFMKGKIWNFASIVQCGESSKLGGTPIRLEQHESGNSRGGVHFDYDTNNSMRQMQFA